MVQFVFVHGVAGPRTTLKTDPKYVSYEAERDARNTKFKDVTFGGNAAIQNPVWSIFGAHPAWDLACVPHAVLKTEPGAVALKIGGLLNEAVDPTLDPNAIDLVAAARADLDAVVGSLSATDIDRAADGAARARAADFWAKVSSAIEDPAQKKKVLAAKTDVELVQRLQAAAQSKGAPQALGFGEDLKALAAKVSGGFTNVVNAPAVLAVRNELTPQIAIFIGDVFIYLKEQSPRDQIRAAVIDAIEAAALAAKASGEKLILCGHSMGGVILYDLLSDQAVIKDLTKRLRLPAGSQFQADLFISVGSQVALFEELKLYTLRDMSKSKATGKKSPRPIGAKLWWNVYNRLDVLSFLAEPVFEDVEDFEASTTAGVKDAHGAYFTNMVFYQRLNTRMKTAGLIP
jgi:peptidyl-tRNA hydrolase